MSFRQDNHAVEMFWQLPELQENLLPFLDPRSILNLAKAFPPTVKILKKLTPGLSGGWMVSQWPKAEGDLANTRHGQLRNSLVKLFLLNIDFGNNFLCLCSSKMTQLQDIFVFSQFRLYYQCAAKCPINPFLRSWEFQSCDYIRVCSYFDFNWTSDTFPQT